MRERGERATSAELVAFAKYYLCFARAKVPARTFAGGFVSSSGDYPMFLPVSRKCAWSLMRGGIFILFLISLRGMSVAVCARGIFTNVESRVCSTTLGDIADEKKRDYL